MAFNEIYREINNLKVSKKEKEYLFKVFSNLRLEVDLTYQCNLSCSGCNRILDLDNTMISKNNIVTIDALSKVLDDSLKLNLPFNRIALVGGEPTLHPNIKEMILLSKGYSNKIKKCHCVLTTNGISKKTIEVISFAKENGFIITDTSKDKIEDSMDYFYSHLIVPEDENQLDNRHFLSCDRPMTCGIGLNYRGLTICHFGNTVDYFFGCNSICTSLDEFTPSKVIEQIQNYCSKCGVMCNPKFDKEYISKKWIKVLSEDCNMEKKKSNLIQIRIGKK